MIIKKIIFIYLLSLFFSCSTEKNKIVNKFYHNTNAYYNGYYNAREIFKLKKYDFDNKDNEDYSKILKVNKVPTEEQSKEWLSEMDIVIEKTSKVIRKHSMPKEKKGKNSNIEYGKWMDENWLLMGKAHFYKKEFDKSIEIFSYIKNMYKNQDSKFLATIWLARTYLEMGDNGTAYKYLEEIKSEMELSIEKQGATEEKIKNKKRYDKYKKQNKKKNKRNKNSGFEIKSIKSDKDEKEDNSELIEFPEKYLNDFYSTYADYYLAEKDYSKAIDYIDSSKHSTNDKYLRYRYTYIQGLIEKELGNYSESKDMFKYIIDKNKNYQMVFYAKLNNITMDGSGVQYDELDELANDVKYNEFRDQIYYILAKKQEAEKNYDNAIENYKKSTSFQSSKSIFRFNAFNSLSNIYFNNENYILAYQYSDSALNVKSDELDKKIIEELQSRKDNLQQIVQLNHEINEIDSLFSLSNLDDNKLRKKVEDILYKKKEEEKEKLRLKNELSLKSSNTNNNVNTVSDNFWIYNNAMKEKGKQEFIKNWGNRNYEEDWRRKNKLSTINIIDNENLSFLSNVSENEINDFIAKIPQDEDSKKSSINKLIKKYHLLGITYRDGLKNNDKAISTFETSINKYSDNDKLSPTLYALYNLYEKQSNTTNSNKYKKELIEKYPKSFEAQLLLNPNYNNEFNKGKNHFENKYKEVYSNYKTKNYNLVIKDGEQILRDSMKYENIYKLEYLLANSYYITNQKEKAALIYKNLINTCDNDEIKDISKKILREMNINDYNNENTKDKTNIKIQADYNFNENEEHFFIYLLNKDLDINDVNNKISNFNSSSFRSKNYSTIKSNVNKKDIIIVKSFTNRNEVFSYYIAFKVNKKEIVDLNKNNDFVLISSSNFAKLIDRQDLDNYIDFFNKNYLGKN